MLPINGYLYAAERGLANDSISAEQRRKLSGEIAAIRARIAIYQNRTEQSVALAQQALLLLAENDDAVRGEVALSLAATYEVRDEPYEAEKAYHEAILHSRNCNNLRAALLATRSLALLYVDQGRLRRARKLYQEGLAYALQTQQEQLPPVGFLHVGIGELYYEWNELDAAERHLREGITLGQRGGDVKIWLLGSIGLIRTTLARGHHEQGWSLLAEVEHQAHKMHYERGMAWLQSMRLRI
jgi:LuxR family maltose regulon positive regulatory protein